MTNIAQQAHLKGHKVLVLADGSGLVVPSMIKDRKLKLNALIN